jgi:hypothetical protein
VVVDELAQRHSISGITSLSITGVQPMRVNREMPVSGGIELNLQIVGGYHSWQEFMNRLRTDEAHGFIDYEASDSLHKGMVLIRPTRQLALPCPAKTILIEIEPET